MTSQHAISQSLSRDIYADAVRAYWEPAHPCHVFRSYQVGVDDSEWQLPEPFNGRSATARLVFLGLNPSYDPKEKVPRIGAQFEDWDRYYRDRFDGAPRNWHKLYRRYQRVGELATSSDFRLGDDALVLELIRFRSAKAAGCDDPAVLEHELRTTGRLLEEVAPRAVVANGAAALWGIQRLWPQIQDQVPVGTPLLTVERRPFQVECKWGLVTVIPTRHLSASFGFTLGLLEPLAHVIGLALSA